MAEKEEFSTREKIYFLGILLLEIKEYRYSLYYYLFGFIPLIQITKYPELGEGI